MLGEGSQTGAQCNTSLCEQATGRLRSEHVTPGFACRCEWTWVGTAVVWYGQVMFPWRSRACWQWFLSLEWYVCFLLPVEVSITFAVFPWPSLKLWLPCLGAGRFFVGHFLVVWGLLQQDILQDIPLICCWRFLKDRGGVEEKWEYFSEESVLGFIYVCLSTCMCIRRILYDVDDAA